MDILLFLIPLAVFLSLGALAAFFWTVKTGQYDDPEGDARRILFDEDDKKPSGD
jgi:cbb3-type cytochrome oxidase maturation protein